MLYSNDCGSKFRDVGMCVSIIFGENHVFPRTVIGRIFDGSGSSKVIQFLSFGLRPSNSNSSFEIAS